MSGASGVKGAAVVAAEEEEVLPSPLAWRESFWLAEDEFRTVNAEVAAEEV